MSEDFLLAAFEWDLENVKKLRALWDKGFPAGDIAAKLGGGCSRNAVLGKVHRLKQSGKPMPARSNIPRTRFNREAQPVNHTPTVAPLKTLRIIKAPPAPPPDSARVTILQLTSGTCRWPIGDPRADDFCFCGHTPQHGSSYCEYHTQIGCQQRVPRKIDDSARPKINMRLHHQ